MNLIKETQRANSTRSIAEVMKCIWNYFAFQKKRIEKAPKLNQIIRSSVDIKTMQVVGYVVGDKVDRCKDLTLGHFEEVTFLNESKNPIKKDTFYHFLCKSGGRSYLVICKLK